MRDMNFGTVLARDARAHLARVLGCAPEDDPTVQFWASMRWEVENAPTPRDSGRPAGAVTRIRAHCLDRAGHGARVGELAWRSDRPVRAEMNAANAFLLERHPALAGSLHAFAMLESLYALNCVANLAAPRPSSSGTVEDASGHAQLLEAIHRVEACTAHRISRALELLRSTRCVSLPMRRRKLPAEFVSDPAEASLA
jgi:hypothetical protein